MGMKYTGPPVRLERGAFWPRRALHARLGI